MAEKQKSLGKALLRLFVVKEESASAEDAGAAAGPQTGDATVDDLIARYAEKPSAAGAPTPVVPLGSAQPLQLDVSAVLERQGITRDEQGHVERILQLLGNLPTEASREVKRQIVEASLMAFGIPVDRIIESAVLELGAFDRHVQAGHKETQALLDESKRRLAALEQEAARIRQVMAEQEKSQEALQVACDKEKVKVQQVLDFFGNEAVERVKHASVRLRDTAFHTSS